MRTTAQEPLPEVDRDRPDWYDPP